ncbi:hypothetical protein EGJ28_24290 [Stutzerimonas xanthomarina]|uniref:site-specific DNA-methyltransferase (adenine-specific) n=1 Tax=Stutzerimonas xanthomarina TaxID=271420 RepID=A0A427DJT2_9GAMM|nr:N-6 DNA methylase [Stutzerimonas xanthomarina]RRV03303.1 hypothetical protein EGJ28_24290 [Stutzerimonas xanthomarina]
MSQMCPLDLVTANPAYRKLMPHIFLVILWHPHSEKEWPESFDEGFFERAAWKVSETSPSLADALRRRLSIYNLETGSLANHHEYFCAIAHGLPEDDSLRSGLLEALLQLFEADGSHEGARLCPDGLIHLITGICQQTGGRSFYDPLSATGRLLAELVSNSAPSSFGLGHTAADEDILHGLLRAYFMQGSLAFEKADALSSPPINEGIIQSFDVVVSDLSAGADTWDPELGARDSLRRFRYGTAPKGKGEWPFIQHMLACMRPGHGMAVAVVDLAALLREGKEAEIRRAIIQANLLDAVIYLPPKLYRSDARALAILVFKSSRHSRSVLLIDGSKQYTSEKSLNTLTPVGIQQIQEHYSRREPVDRNAVLLSTAELETNGFVLNPRRYFSARPEEGLHDLEALCREHEHLKSELLDVGAQIDELLGRLTG